MLLEFIFGPRHSPGKKGEPPFDVRAAARSRPAASRPRASRLSSLAPQAPICGTERVRGGQAVGFSRLPVPSRRVRGGPRGRCWSLLACGILAVPREAAGLPGAADSASSPGTLRWGFCVPALRRGTLALVPLV